MKNIGYHLTDQQYMEYNNTFFRNKNEIPIDYKFYYRYPNESNYDSINKIYFYWDRSSKYNSFPYIPTVLSTNYPYSKLLYIVRDPLFQQMSHIRNFHEGQTVHRSAEDKLNLTEKETNQRFNKLLKYFQSDLYKPLWSLLTDIEFAEFNDKIENDIISWYTSLWIKKGISWHTERIYDKCPVVNILNFVKNALIFNKNYGLKNFKLIQLEWESDNFILSSIYIYCWSVFNEYKLNNKCIKKYTLNNYENLNEIMFNYEKFKNNSKETGSEKYWKFTNITIFDEII